MQHILIIEPSTEFCSELCGVLAHIGHEAICAYSLQEGLDKLHSACAAIVVLNASMPDGKGIDVIARIKHESPSSEVVVISDSVSPDEAEEAIKNGAWEYLEKPHAAQSLASLIDRAAQIRSHTGSGSSQGESQGKQFDGIVGSSPQLRACLDIVGRAANSDANVLIKGETGTGKELIAWAIHRNSPRTDGNFVVVDCAALPEPLVESTLLGHEKGAFTGADKAQTGLIKQADGGTLFLDEVGEMPLSVQKSFLRVLEKRRFRPVGGKEEIQSDFRLISASNRNLDKMAQNGEFREDLLFRIRSFGIEVPPLRQRKEDIRSLVIYYMPKICDRLGIGVKEISPEFYDALFRYNWPGNVRELVNSLERSLVAARVEDILLPQQLPTYLRVQLARSSVQRGGPPEKTAKENLPDCLSILATLQTVREIASEQAERQYLQKLISLTHGDIKESCRISKLSRSRLYALLKKHQIQIPR